VHQTSLISVRSVAAILRREWLAAFGHPLAYVALGVFLGLFALFTLWFDDVLVGGVASMRAPFRWMIALLVLVASSVTMRSISEERRTGTLHVLATLPLTSTEIVVGKWLAAVSLVTAALALTATWPAALAWHGDLDPGPVLAGYAGVLAAGAVMAAIGIAASAATDSQVSAFLVSASVSGIPWLVGLALPLVPRAALPLVQYATFDYHFGNLAEGVLDSRSVAFFATVTLVALRIAVHRLEARRLS
jgi:ABC-2 type transport system permease protein